jgi:LPS-assembly protein
MKWFFGRDILVTMEPRAFYVYTPFQSQAQTPLFDTADAGFGVTQIFSENTFVGSDRVADSNKLTTGLTSRILEANTGAERATVTLAQRLDFAGQRVGLNGTITNPIRQAATLILLIETSGIRLLQVVIPALQPRINIMRLANGLSLKSIECLAVGAMMR